LTRERERFERITKNKRKEEKTRVQI